MLTPKQRTMVLSDAGLIYDPALKAAVCELAYLDLDPSDAWDFTGWAHALAVKRPDEWSGDERESVEADVYAMLARQKENA
jgi:hypothetical protein